MAELRGRQDQTKKEALFNEVKGSLFEYLVARELAVKAKDEIAFQRSFDKNYLTVLSQQDRMVRQFYPEMLPFLSRSSKITAEALISYLKETPREARVVGKFSNSLLSSELHEADLVLMTTEGRLPVSLKLNKKNAFVNTKSGGIKSFFTQYFPFLPLTVQESFNLFVDREFQRMGNELHALHELEFQGHFQDWVKKGLSELPGELDQEGRRILKVYYARLAKEMHSLLKMASEKWKDEFIQSLPPLMGFGSKDILQVIFFHHFPDNSSELIDIHSYEDLNKSLPSAKVLPFGDISSVEVELGEWSLQIRIKPMNKFTTTAIKINCSVKTKRPSIS